MDFHLIYKSQGFAGERRYPGGQGGGGDESKNQTPLVDVSHNVNILQIVHDCQKMVSLGIVGIIKI